MSAGFHLLRRVDLHDHQDEAAEGRDPEAVECQRVRHEVCGQLECRPAQEGVGEEHQAEGEAAGHQVQQGDEDADQPQDDCDQRDAAERRPRQVVEVDRGVVVLERQPPEGVEDEQQARRDQ